MSDQLLRMYMPHECGADGYPFAWHYGWGEGPLPIAGYDFVAYDEPPIKDLIREQAGHRCERCRHPFRVGETPGQWSPCDEQCTHGGPVRRENFESGFGPVEALWRVLTVHHLDENKRNCHWWNLVALCQRCHLRMQRAVVMDRPYHYEHSEWFRPYAAAFYAFKYLQENLTREEVEARMDELLRLEHRFTQDALL